MPAAYAHNRFGGECIDTMPEKMRTICENHREIFDFGVHGPDILFYNEPMKKNEVNSRGSEMHHRSGREFFTKCREVYQANPEKGEMLAYILGFLAHFALDSSCHGYINEMDRTTPMSHNFIESQYEAYLMRLDGRDPLKTDRSESLHPSKKTALVIAHFFEFPEKEILKSLKGQRTTMKLLYSPTERKKKVLRKAIGLLKIGGNFDDLFLDAEEVQGCHATNEEIFRLQGEALQRYPELMRNLMQFLLDEAELEAYFDHNFEGEVVAQTEDEPGSRNAEGKAGDA